MSNPTTIQLKGNVELCDDASTALTIKKPITPSYTYPPSTNTMIGFQTKPTITWSTSAFSSIATSVSLPIGNYMIMYTVTLTGTFVPNFLYLGGSVFSTVLDQWRTPFVASVVSSGYTMINGGLPFYNEAERTISLIVYEANAYTLVNGQFIIMRLS